MKQQQKLIYPPETPTAPTGQNFPVLERQAGGRYGRSDSLAADFSDNEEEVLNGRNGGYLAGQSAPNIVHAYIEEQRRMQEYHDNLVTQQERGTPVGMERSSPQRDSISAKHQRTKVAAGNGYDQRI